MGQPINVVEKPSRTPGIARFETNRSLTGMGHERYPSAEAIVDNRAVDELARRLFATGGVTWVHVNGSVITVALRDGWIGEQLLDAIRGLYIHYPPAAGTPASAAAISDSAGEEASVVSDSAGEEASVVSDSDGEEAAGGDTSATNGAAVVSEAGAGGAAPEADAEPVAGTGITERDVRQ